MKRRRDASSGVGRRADAPVRRGARSGLLVLAVAVALFLVFALGSTVRPAVGSNGPRETQTVATVPEAGAGPSCVNVWMGGNPDAPNACRPAPGR